MATDDGDAGLRPRYPILTDRLALRPHRIDDLEDLVSFHGDPDVVRFVPWPLRDRAATEEALRVKLDQTGLSKAGEWLVLAVEERETGTVIGEVLLKWASVEHRQGELGFAFGQDFQGRGYATEAARAVLRLGFEDLGLHRITAVCIEENEASARLLQRLGFERQARFVDGVWFKGAWATQLVYALTEDPWRAGRRHREIDVDELSRLVHCFFDAFTSGDGVDTRLDALRAVMLPGAIVVRTCGQPPAVDDIESFLEPRRALLLDGSLTNFTECAVGGRFDIFGDIAHWFGRYVKDGTYHGAPYPGAGMKSIQFIHASDGWRISAVAWDDDRDGLTADGHTSANRYAQAQAR